MTFIVCFLWNMGLLCIGAAVGLWVGSRSSGESRP